MVMLESSIDNEVALFTGCRSGVFNVNFEQILHIVKVLSLLTLNK